MRKQTAKAAWVPFLAALLFSAACATSPTGRRQLILVSDAELGQTGAAAFDQMKQKTPVEHDPEWNRFVRCVALPITEVVNRRGGPALPKEWEIVVFRDDTANAFALPGGKIGVHTGILSVAKTDAQLAAVIGHEVGHVLARHGNERVSENVLAGGTIQLIDVLTGKGEAGSKKPLLMGALGLGAQFGVLLPHSRDQESEADVIGLDLMARAGFDPRQSAELWRNMMAASKGAPPEFMSTHPASENRIKNLESHFGEAMPHYEAAKGAGHAPSCPKPH